MSADGDGGGPASGEVESSAAAAAPAVGVRRGLNLEAVAAALPGYDIGDELGRGASGIVIAARQRHLGRDVAVKQLPRAFGAEASVRSRFIAEARLLASLDHPHVVPIYDFVEHDDLCLLIMEHLPGGTVWGRFRDQGLTAPAACAAVVAACAGLHHAHRRGVLHRDVKPENLMFSGDNVLKVTDFGIAKMIGGGATMATRDGYVLGTPAYIAPEQALGEELTPATDVYAAGTVLFELLTGQLPYPEGADPLATVYQHVHLPPADLRAVAPHLPDGLAAVTARALARDPLDRYPTADELRGAIAEAAESEWGQGWATASGLRLRGTDPIPSRQVKPPPPPAWVRRPGTIRTPDLWAPATPSSPSPVISELVPLQAALRDRPDRGSGTRGSRAGVVAIGVAVAVVIGVVAVFALRGGNSSSTVTPPPPPSTSPPTTAATPTTTIPPTTLAAPTPPTLIQAADYMAHTIEAANPTVSFLAEGSPVTVNDASGVPFTAWVGRRNPSPDGTGELLFFFRGRTFLGWNQLAESTSIGPVTASGSSITVTYPAPPPPVVITYTLHGKSVSASSPPPPSNGVEVARGPNFPPSGFYG